MFELKFNLDVEYEYGGGYHNIGPSGRWIIRRNLGEFRFNFTTRKFPSKMPPKYRRARNLRFLWQNFYTSEEKACRRNGDYFLAAELTRSLEFISTRRMSNKYPYPRRERKEHEK